MVKSIGPKRPFRLFIREWLAIRGINQEQLAGRIEVESGTMSKLMNGRMQMTTEHLAAIAFALDVEVDQLFRDPKRPSQDELLTGRSEDDLRKALKIIDAMKDAI